MKTVVPIGAFEPFTPESIDAMQAAFNEACKIVGATERHQERETIAMSIISTAQRGIHDRTFLRDEAVAQWRRSHAFSQAP